MGERTLLVQFLDSVKIRFIGVMYRVNVKRKTMRDIGQLESIEERFTNIYKTKSFWGSKESYSGTGSTIGYTDNFRKHLPKMINEFSIKSIFDAPCGDCNWMKLVLSDVDVDYTGADIVKPLIDSNNLKYKNSLTNFVHFNIVKNKFPKADLWICRDCLPHLSFEDTFQALERFIESGIPYVLTTTYKNVKGFNNSDIDSGDSRSIDLFSEPYRFDKNVLYRIDDWIKPWPPREMCLWSRDQVINSLDKFYKEVLQKH